MDILLASTWRLDGLTKRARGGGVTAVAESQRPEPQYVWRHSRIEITVDRQGDQWRVMSSTSGRLFGPRQTLYVALHRQAKHAAWDVMACAIRASQSEEDGISAGRAAARWMKDRRFPE
jgi:hypothetical protein